MLKKYPKVEIRPPPSQECTGFKPTVYVLASLSYNKRSPFVPSRTSRFDLWEYYVCGSAARRRYSVVEHNHFCFPKTHPIDPRVSLGVFVDVNRRMLSGAASSARHKGRRPLYASSPDAYSIARWASQQTLVSTICLRG